MSLDRIWESLASSGEAVSASSAGAAATGKTMAGSVTSSAPKSTAASGVGDGDGLTASLWFINTGSSSDMVYKNSEFSLEERQPDDFQAVTCHVRF